jgi:hypothetical protein
MMPFTILDSQNIKYKNNKKKVEVHPVHQALIQMKHKNPNSPYQFFCTLSIIKTFPILIYERSHTGNSTLDSVNTSCCHSCGLQYLAGLWYDLGGGLRELCATVIGQGKASLGETASKYVYLARL